MYRLLCTTTLVHQSSCHIVLRAPYSTFAGLTPALHGIPSPSLLSPCECSFEPCQHELPLSKVELETNPAALTQS